MTAVRMFTLDGARRPHPDVESWLARPPVALRQIALRWIEVMRACGPDVVELLHDGHPTFCVGVAAFGYVNAFKHHVNVGFFLGTSLADPSGILEGDGRFMRHVRVRPEGVDESALRGLIVAAYRDMKTRVSGRPGGEQE